MFFENTAPLYAPRTSENSQNISQVFNRQFLAIFPKLSLKRANVYSYYYRNNKNWEWIYKTKRQSLGSLAIRYPWTSEKAFSFVNPILKKQFVNQFLQKKFELHGNLFILTEYVNLNHRGNHQLFKNWHYVANKWYNWEREAHSTLIGSMTVWTKHYLPNWDGEMYCPNTMFSGTRWFARKNRVATTEKK